MNVSLKKQWKKLRINLWMKNVDSNKNLKNYKDSSETSLNRKQKKITSKLENIRGKMFT